MRQLNNFLGEHEGLVYKLWINNGVIYGAKMNRQGAWGDVDAAYSPDLDWHRAYEGRCVDTTLVMVPWAGGVHQYVVYGNEPLVELDRIKQAPKRERKPKSPELYRGFYIARHGRKSYWAGPTLESISSLAAARESADYGPRETMADIKAIIDFCLEGVGASAS